MKKPRLNPTRLELFPFISNRQCNDIIPGSCSQWALAAPEGIGQYFRIVSVSWLLLKHQIEAVVKGEFVYLWLVH